MSAPLTTKPGTAGPLATTGTPTTTAGSAHPSGETPGSLTRPNRAKTTILALSNLEDALGGRPAVADLVAGTDSDRFDTFRQLLADPRRATDSLADLCADAGLAPISLLTLLRYQTTARSLMDAQARIGLRLGGVVDKVLDAAEGAPRPCGCTLGGTQPALGTCEKCQGTGLVADKPSLAHQRMVLEAAEVLKRPGPMVQVNQGVQVNGGGATATNFFDKMVKGLSAVTRSALAAPAAAAAAPAAPRSDDRGPDPVDAVLVETPASDIPDLV